MKYVNICLVAASLIMMSSSIKTENPSTGYFPGSQIPNITVAGEEGITFDLSEYRDKKIVLSFWASYDAQSRALNVQLHNYLKNKAPDVKFLSLSFDENRNVFNKTALLDKIDLESLVCDENGTNSKIYKDFQLKKGFKSYLIDEDGIIMSINVSVEDLDKLL